MTAIPQAQNFNDLGSVVMSYVYAFSSIIGADFRQKFAGVQCGAALPRCPGGGAARQAVRQEFITKKPAKFAGKDVARADTCGGTV